AALLPVRSDEDIARVGRDDGGAGAPADGEVDLGERGAVNRGEHVHLTVDQRTQPLVNAELVPRVARRRLAVVQWRPALRQPGGTVGGRVGAGERVALGQLDGPFARSPFGELTRRALGLVELDAV